MTACNSSVQLTRELQSSIFLCRIDQHRITSCACHGHTERQTRCCMCAFSHCFPIDYEQCTTVGHLDTFKIEKQEQLTRHHQSHCSRSITPSEELLLPAESSHGVIETTSMTMHTHGSTFSSVRRKQEGSNAMIGSQSCPRQ